MSDTDEAELLDTTPLNPPKAILKIVTDALNFAQNDAMNRGDENATLVISRSGSSINQAAVISNCSDVDLKQYIKTSPSSGRYSSTPPSEIPSFPSPDQAFLRWQKSSDSPPDAKKIAFANLTEDLAKLLAKWIRKGLGGAFYSAPLFAMGSTGAGVEGVTVYLMDLQVRPDETKTVPVVVVFYLNNPFIGSTEAGGFFMDRQSFELAFEPEAGDLSQVIDYIQESRKYSSGSPRTETYNPARSRPHYSYEMTFWPNVIANFKLDRELVS